MKSFLAITRKRNGLFLAFLREQIPGTEKESTLNENGEKFAFVASTTAQVIKHAEDYLDEHKTLDIKGYIFIKRKPPSGA